MKKPKIIAEIGCNHKGDLKIAKEMIIIASRFCNVEVVKFQKRHPKELLTFEQYNQPHPNPQNAYGSTYGYHREALEFSIDQHRELKETCEQNGSIYCTSVWDLTSAREVTAINPQLIKIPSACNLNWPMLDYLCDNYSGQIHLSFGMTTRLEEDSIINRLIKKGRNKDVVLYSCTSGYPVSFEEICLLEITRLKEQFGSVVADIGFSGHHLGIAADIAAMALGVSWIERHFTLDRTWKGTDHAASLEPNGLRRLVRDVKNVACALSFKNQDILEVEKSQREKLKRLV